MNNADRLSRQQYAAEYDEHAGSLYKFALCVIGDKNQAEAAMVKLFCEGYADAVQENFIWHMLGILRRILESYPPDADGYRKSIKATLPDKRHDKLIDLLCSLPISRRAELLQKLMFENIQIKAAS